MSFKEIKTFMNNYNKKKQGAWIAGSITAKQMPSLWKTGVDVICVRGTACETGSGRHGNVNAIKVAKLTSTIKERR